MPKIVSEPILGTYFDSFSINTEVVEHFTLNYLENISYLLGDNVFGSSINKYKPFVSSVEDYDFVNLSSSPDFVHFTSAKIFQNEYVQNYVPNLEGSNGYVQGDFLSGAGLSYETIEYLKSLVADDSLHVAKVNAHVENSPYCWQIKLKSVNNLRFLLPRPFT